MKVIIRPGEKREEFFSTRDESRSITFFPLQSKIVVPHYWPEQHIGLLNFLFASFPCVFSNFKVIREGPSSASDPPKLPRRVETTIFATVSWLQHHPQTCVCDHCDVDMMEQCEDDDDRAHVQLWVSTSQ